MSGQSDEAREHRAKQESHRRESLLRIDAVLARTGLRKSQWYHLIREGLAPAAIEIAPGGRTRVWIESEIQAFIDTRIAVARTKASKS